MKKGHRNRLETTMDKGWNKLRFDPQQNGIGAHFTTLPMDSRIATSNRSFWRIQLCAPFMHFCLYRRVTACLESASKHCTTVAQISFAQL